MSDLDMVNILVAAGVPWLVAIINRSAWPSLAKWSVYAAVSVGVAALTTYLGGDINRDSLLRSVLIVLVAAAGFYRLWFTAVKSVEQATG